LTAAEAGRSPTSFPYKGVQINCTIVQWQEPRPTQICTELDDGIVLIKDETTGEPIGIELLSYRPGDARFDSVNVEVGAAR
jgi:hypothetical protein